MSKILIVYYSLTGSTRFIAETLTEPLNADILELKPIKDLRDLIYFKLAHGLRLYRRLFLRLKARGFNHPRWEPPGHSCCLDGSGGDN